MRLGRGLALRLLRGLRGPVKPKDYHTSFIRACLPGNAKGLADLEKWLASGGGPAALRPPDNPFKPNLPALADAMAQRGEKPPPQLQKILGFTEIVEPMRADRYWEIIEKLTSVMAAAGLAGFLGGDAAAARLAYRRIEARHVAGVKIIAPARDLPRLQALFQAEGFFFSLKLSDALELKNEHGARILLGSQLLPFGTPPVENMLADHPGGLTLLPLPLLFVYSCVAGYPPVDAAHSPAMIDAALLATRLTPDDWAAVARLEKSAGKKVLRMALRYLQGELGVAIPLDF